MRTLRARLTWWNLVIVSLALTVFAVLLYSWLARTLYEHHDADLALDLDKVAALVRNHGDSPSALERIDAADRGGPLLVLRDAAGTVRFRSSPLASIDLDAGAQQALAHAQMPEAEGRYFTVAIAGEPVRFVCVALSAPPDGYLQVGRRLGEVEELLETVVIASAVLVPLVLMLTSFGGLMVARRALLPIEQIGSTLESIQATDLSRRVQPGTTDTEVTRLSSSINRLLDRLQASFTAMRDFTSEVSHQLKTPLTVMKSAAEAAARDGRSERLHQTLGELSVDIDALTATISDLRTYALADADSAPAGAAAVNVSEVFMEAAEIIRALAEAHDISCDITVESGLLARGNAVGCGRLFSISVRTPSTSPRRAVTSTLLRGANTRMQSWKLRTPARAFLRRTCPTFLIATSRRGVRTAPGALGWGWRSPDGLSKRTGARSPSRAPSGKGPEWLSSCRLQADPARLGDRWLPAPPVILRA